MSNFIINFTVSVAAYYFCKMLDEIYTYLRSSIKEIWNTYSPTYEYLFFIFICYISLIVFWTSFLILNLNVYCK